MNTYEETMVLHMMPAEDFQKQFMQKSKKQLRGKTEIDTAVCNILDGDALKDALFVVDNIRENGMKIKWASANTWSVKHRRKHVCDLKILNDSLSIGPVNDVLATRVKVMSNNQESIEELIDALRNSISGTREAFVLSH